MKQVLITRTDRIGDVILSTPAFRAFKEAHPRCRLSVFVRQNVAPLLEGCDFIDELLIAPMNWLEMVRQFGRFDASVCLFSDPRVASALFAARVPVRIGPLSKPHSYCFYNRGIRQRRSQVQMHEADYNLELLQPLGVSPSSPLATSIFVSEADQRQAAAWLAEAGYVQGDQPLVVMHPGMGGSALNWPQKNYLELADQLLQENWQVLISSGPMDTGVLGVFRERLGHRALFYSGERSIGFLAALMSQADLVIAPSTGPLHVAVALGIPVVSFYPPIRVQSPERWGPYQPVGKANVLVPEQAVGEDLSGCMSKLSVTETLKVIHNQFHGHV